MATPINPPELARPLQEELKRVGCYNDAIDGAWGDGSRRGLERFAKRKVINVRTDVPTMRALQAAEEAERGTCRRDRDRD